jgi:hypothetical protein
VVCVVLALSLVFTGIPLAIFIAGIMTGFWSPFSARRSW